MSSAPWSEKGSKGTIVNADEFLILDSADGNLATKNKRVSLFTLKAATSDLSLPLAGGSMTGDITMTSFNKIVFGTGRLEFPTGSSLREIANLFVFDISTGGSVFFSFGSNSYTFNSTTADFGGNNLINLGATTLKIDDTTARLTLEANHNIPANGQEVGAITFVDDNQSGDPKEYGKIDVVIHDPSTSIEEGEMFFSVLESGGLTNYVELNLAGNNTIRFVKDLDMASNSITAIGILDYTDAIATIAAGVLTSTVTYQSVAGQGGNDDDLVTITAGTTGQYLIIRPSNGTVTITVTNTGNIVTIGGDDFVMDDIEDTMTLIYDGTNWVELSRNVSFGVGVFLPLAGGTMSGAIDMDGNGILSLANPTLDQDAATKIYVDSSSGVIAKQGADLATTANITLSGEQMIDGTMTSTSRVLVKNQTNDTENGIYDSAGGVWSRSADADQPIELRRISVFVLGGSVNEGLVFFQTDPVLAALGFSPIVFLDHGFVRLEGDTMNGTLNMNKGAITLSNFQSIQFNGFANRVGTSNNNMNYDAGPGGSHAWRIGGLPTISLSSSSLRLDNVRFQFKDSGTTINQEIQSLVYDVVFGAVDSYPTVPNPGTLYVNGEVLNPVGQTSGAGAAIAQLTVIAGEVQSVAVIIPGSGYIEGETVDLPSNGAGINGTATVAVLDGSHIFRFNDFERFSFTSKPLVPTLFTCTQISDALTDSAELRLRKAQTIPSGSVPILNSSLGKLTVYGAISTGVYREGGRLEFLATETWAPIVHGTRFELSTTPNSGNFPILRFTIEENGTTNLEGNNLVNAPNVTSADGVSDQIITRAATVIAGVLSTDFANAQSIDGVALVTGDTILIKNQTDTSENGIYTVNVSGAPTRDTNANSVPELINISAFITEGDDNANLTFTQSGLLGTLESTPIIFLQAVASPVPVSDQTFYITSQADLENKLGTDLIIPAGKNVGIYFQNDMMLTKGFQVGAGSTLKLDSLAARVTILFNPSPSTTFVANVSPGSPILRVDMLNFTLIDLTTTSTFVDLVGTTNNIILLTQAVLVFDFGILGSLVNGGINLTDQLYAGFGQGYVFEENDFVLVRNITGIANFINPSTFITSKGATLTDNNLRELAGIMNVGDAMFFIDPNSLPSSFSTITNINVIPPTDFFQLGTDIPIIAVADNGGQAVFATGTSDHGLSVGDKVNLTNFATSSYNGTFIVTATISTLTFETGVAFVDNITGTLTDRPIVITAVTDGSPNAIFTTQTLDNQFSVGRAVVVSGFGGGNPLYDGTFIVTAATTTTFETGVAFNAGGTGTANSSSLNSTDTRITSLGNFGAPDSMFIGGWFHSTNTASTTILDGTFSPLNLSTGIGVTVFTENERFTVIDANNGTLQYDGTISKTVTLLGILSMQKSGSTQNYNLRYAISRDAGVTFVALPTPLERLQAISTTNRDTSLQQEVVLNLDDRIRIEIEGVGTANSVEISFASLDIKG